MNLDSVVESEVKVTVGNAMCEIRSLSADLVNTLHSEPHSVVRKAMLLFGKLSYILTYL